MRAASLSSPAAATVPAAAGRTTRVTALAAIRWAAWSASAVLALGFLTVPIGPEAQMELCGAAIAAMAILWLVFPRRGLPRTAFLALGSLVVIRYAYWRLSGTLPSTDDVVSFGLGLVLVAAEAYCFTILAVSLIINAEPLVRADAPALDEAALPTVDVFIPTYNEDAGILAATVAAARNLDYPADKLTVWLLDDGGSDQKCADADPAKRAAAQGRRVELQALCAELGARYLTRARNEHAKAGNLNNGLKASRADIVVVLDADHAPFRPFLRETVGLFSADPKLFLVQTPHVFLNPDPIERNLRTFARMPSENEMFYAVTQRGLDKWNGSFFCGSAALLRRAALDEVGGFSGITITEDCETAFELHSRGWTSAYVDKPLIAGLQPETFADFIGQRARWCQGMFQIMLLKNPMTKPGLKPIQRLGYLSSMAYWFFPLPRLIFMLAPLLHIFFDVKIFVSSVDEALAFTATYVVVNMMLQNYLYGHVRWPWVSELYEYVQGVYLARSIASVLISPRKPTFNVTAKGANLDRDHISPLAWPFFAIFGALALGCGTAAFRYLYEPGVTSLMLVVGLWCLFNLVIAGAALGVVSERAQAERSPSLAIARRGTATFGGETFPVAVERISADACTLRRSDGAAWPRTEGASGTAPGCLVGAPLTGEGRLDPLPFSVRAAQGEDARVVGFENLTPASYRGLADLMYGDATPLWDFLAGRRRPVGLLSGSLRFLGWGLLEPVRAFTLLARTRGRMPPARAAAPATPAADILATAPIAASVAVLPVATAMPLATAMPVAAAIADAPALAVEHRPVLAAFEPGPAPRAAPAPIPAPAVSSPDALPVLRLSAEAWLAGMVTLAKSEIAEAEAARTEASAELNPRAWMNALLQMARADVPASAEAPRAAARGDASPARRTWVGPPTATLVRNAA